MPHVIVLLVIYKFQNVPEPDNLLVLALWLHFPPPHDAQQGACCTISALGRLLQKGTSTCRFNLHPSQTPSQRLLEVTNEM